MNDIASLTYETLMAYIMPAAIVELIYLPLLNDHLNLKLDKDLAGYLVLGFIGLSIVVGLLLDMWGHMVEESSGWLKKRRNIVFFGEPDRRNVLFQCMDALYPKTSEQTKVELVYAIFDFHASEHIYARRNWDWTFHEASRNILASVPLSLVGLWLLATRYTWPIVLIIGVIVATIVIISVLCWYTLWSLKIYYGYYTSVTLGHLLEQSAQAVGRAQSLAGTKTARGN